MTARTRNLEQIATYWPPGNNDGFGDVSFGTPITVQVRWQNKAELFRDDQANEVVSNAVVYIDQAVENKGYLSLGNQTAESSPIGLDAAYEVRAVGNTPNLSNSEVLYKAWL